MLNRGDEVVKILDFGLAKLRENTNTTFAGTPRYSPAEQLDPLSKEPITEKTDVYSVSVMLWEILAGVHPYAGQIKDLGRMHLINFLKEDRPAQATRKSW